MRVRFPVCIALLLVAGCFSKKASNRGYLKKSGDTTYLADKITNRPARFLSYQSFNYRLITEREEEDPRRLGLILPSKTYYSFFSVSHTGFGNETGSCIIHLTKTLIMQRDGRSLALSVLNFANAIKGRSTTPQSEPVTYPILNEASGIIFYDQQPIPFYYKHTLTPAALIPNHYEGWMVFNKDTLKVDRHSLKPKLPLDYWLELSKNGIVYAAMNMYLDYGRLYILRNRTTEERLLLAAYLFIVAEAEE